jgi:hypothetical protein
MRIFLILLIPFINSFAFTSNWFISQSIGHETRRLNDNGGGFFVSQSFTPDKNDPNSISTISTLPLTKVTVTGDISHDFAFIVELGNKFITDSKKTAHSVDIFLNLNPSDYRFTTHGGGVEDGDVNIHTLKQDFTVGAKYKYMFQVKNFWLYVGAGLSVIQISTRTEVFSHGFAINDESNVIFERRNEKFDNKEFVIGQRLSLGIEKDINKNVGFFLEGYYQFATNYIKYYQSSFLDTRGVSVGLKYYF